MLSNKNLLLIGAVGSVAVTIVIASLFSSMTASAQTMMPTMQNKTNNMTMMQHGQNHFSKGHDIGMFSVMGMSMAKDVAVTGVSVTGDKEITVNVRYTGNETSTPGIGVFVMTNHMDMMKGHMGAMMHDSQNYGMSGGQQWSNSTADMVQGAWESHSGSNFVKGGWTASGNTIKVKLDGSSAYDARDIMVMVSPYLG